ncbi:MAG: sigma-54-dependent Fis family transcriptional regulator [Rhodospirillales bacterium]|nr:sigma-54-dependent Fis family transcriptional regulator [Alphaproteobacteria bacterium]MCB9977951.1 sigma-54-dependent Fis family transcriptional regulator [Rhodospirillales bacterium]
MTTDVLIVDDDTLHSSMLATLLRRKLGFESIQAENGRQALDLLENNENKKISLIILDLNMPIMGGMETLEIIHQKYPSLPVIMLTGNQDFELAIQAMKLGASDFLVKPYEGERLAVTVKNALKLSNLSREVQRLSQTAEGTFSFNALIGHDQGLQHAVNLGRKAASSDIPVLISGETGTGKEVVARAIHGESNRAGKSFIAVNCGAIPSQLVESTLFGHEKGAFTGATEKTIGKFREAEGGTIFLDEVGELPLDAQVKLLRVLQQKEVEPVGASKAVPVNVRIISATNRNLQDEIKKSQFREDLYFRLNVLEIALPPLKERKKDILDLAQHFLDRESARHGQPPKFLSGKAQEVLEHQDWPGNIRELENTIKRAYLLSEETEVQAHDLSASKQTGRSSASKTEPTQNEMTINLFNKDGTIKTAEEVEQDAIQKVLAFCGQNITEASKALGIAKSTFYRKISKSD